MDKNFLGILIVITVAVIFGIAILTGVTTQIAGQATLYNVVNESHNTFAGMTPFSGGNYINTSLAASNFTVNANEQANITNVQVGNGTVNLTQGTDYFVLNNGNFNNGVYISLRNTTATTNLDNTTNLTLVWYTYQPIGYTTGTPATALNLIVIFAAVAIFIVAFIGVKRDWFSGWF